MKKTIVISGGTKGIGKALVWKFAQEGFEVITCARNLADLEALKTDLKKEGFNVHIYAADLSKKGEVSKFVDFVKKVSGEVDILINNTGIFLPGQIHKEEEGVLEKQVETNLYSAYFLTRGLVPEMIKRREGYIFNMCSTASVTPYVNGGSYCISKYALYGMTKVLREELKEYNIKVTAVLPGATLTASWDGTTLPDQRFMKPEDIADSVFSAYKLSKNTVVEEILLRPQLGDIK